METAARGGVGISSKNGPAHPLAHLYSLVCQPEIPLFEQRPG